SLDSTYIDRDELRWLEKETKGSRAEWKIAYLHHPLYTSGRYTLAARGIRFSLESTFVNGGVNVVFTGHEHIYERSELQQGILYFISGGAGSLREGDAHASPMIARSYDHDYHFMLVEITDEGLFFQAINRVGVTVDAGVLKRPTADTAGHQ
ncbi:MAG: metallophosphoesterase, partial [Acidobacteriota bacterium]